MVILFFPDDAYFIIKNGENGILDEWVSFQSFYKQRKINRDFSLVYHYSS